MQILEGLQLCRETVPAQRRIESAGKRDKSVGNQSFSGGTKRLPVSRGAQAACLWHSAALPNAAYRKTPEPPPCPRSRQVAANYRLAACAPRNRKTLRTLGRFCLQRDVRGWHSHFCSCSKRVPTVRCSVGGSSPLTNFRNRSEKTSGRSFQ